MKRFFFTILAVAAIALTVSATDLTGKRIYVNPGHGSFGSNDRPMATIPYPNLPTTGMPDTMGFYESNTDMWKCEYLGQRLAASGATVVYSRTTSGPWPYVKVNGDYPGYSSVNYSSLSNYEQYNRNLSEICEEVEAGNFDLFISVHSNAAKNDGSTTNFPLYLFRGQTNGTSTHETSSKAIGAATWPYRWDMFGAGFDYASGRSLTNMYLAGDWDFYDGHSASTRSNGQVYDGYLGVLKHGVPGGLWEGYFHTYQPARHRALNHDYCAMEGISYYRGIMDYFGCTPDPLGYICGTVKDMDNKMNHSLYKYAPKTNDQWVPCNGATVYLLSQAGDTLQSYNVDTCYNGVFVFYGLQPGTYHLAASCPGYTRLDAEQRAADVVVTANTTTFPFIFLRRSDWEPEPIKYETYPDRSTANGLNGHYNFGAAQQASFASVVAGKLVRQVLVRDDQETYVLALDTTTGAHASHIYRINTLTGALLSEVSTEGTQGDYYPVYNIAFTADSILVGCNYGENQYDDTKVNSGNTHVRGTFRTYYWNMADLTAAPSAWFTSQWCGNFYNANVGRSFGVAGMWKEATVYSDAVTISGTKIRVAQFSTDAGALISIIRNQNPSDNSVKIQTDIFGDYTAIASANADDEALLLGTIKSMEYAYTTDAGVPNIHFEMPAAKGAESFRFGGQAVLAAPVVSAGALTGVRLYNYTDSRSAFGTVTTNIALNVPATCYSVHPLASGEDIVLYVATDSAIYRYTTAGETQPSFVNIYAYGITLTENADDYTIAYTLNTDATTGAVVFSDNSRIALTGLTAGAHTITVAKTDIPTGDNITWGIEVSAPEVGSWSTIAAKPASVLGTTRAFNAVNTYPETEHFGTIYLMDRKGANSSASGLLVMSPDYTLQYTTPAKGSQSYYGSPYRFAVAPDGFVFVTDWADPHSGIYVVDPADPQNAHANFFAGSQDGAGLWKHNGVEEGSSTPSAFIAGSGADTKLYVYNEDPGSTLPTNGLCVYNIGLPDGSIAHAWDGAPSAKMTFSGQANTNGNVWACSTGVWVSQHRSAGNNVSSATSLRFYDWNGNCTFASHEAPVDAYEQLVIEGSLGSCYALSRDEKTLILNGVDGDFMVFDITWAGSTPTLKLAYRFMHNLGKVDYEVLQLNWDYAGNLVASGNAGVYVYAVPQEGNTHFTPARSIYTFHQVAATALTLDVTELDMLVGEKLDITPTIAPAEVQKPALVWTSSDPSVATVAGGRVTAVANGETTITCATADGSLTATCTVTVTTPLKSIKLSHTSATINEGETLQLSVTFNPATASNRTIIWTSDDITVASVDDNGLVTAVGEGFTYINATADADASLTARALITVETLSGIDYVAVDGIFYADGVVYNRLGLDFQIFTAAGQLVGSSYGDDFSMAGMPRGAYIIRANGLTVKFVR